METNHNSFWDYKGLFNRAIAQSGSSLCPWSFSKENGTEENTKQLIKVLDCNNRNTSKEMVDCLKNRSVSDFLNYDLKRKRVCNYVDLLFYSNGTVVFLIYFKNRISEFFLLDLGSLV